MVEECEWEKRGRGKRNLMDYGVKPRLPERRRERETADRVYIVVFQNLGGFIKYVVEFSLARHCANSKERDASSMCLTLILGRVQWRAQLQRWLGFTPTVWKNPSD
ncbi:unnamed protein product [Sphenostylis stenocarpa]|uniref:Uncharacterized protein n=1 Tax=Sphenostylis stenocarpa TaxID=92480 RepID=A0AA86VL20_9FABA|nr:unnamed protein product [Sphenostylis stenocarpa]